METLEVTIPVLNEEASLRENVLKVLDFFDAGFSEKNALKCTIVIADNGSIDNTPEIARKLEIDYSGKVKFLKVPRRGVGLALKTSWLQSDSDIVGYMDLDLATDLKHLNNAVEILRGDGDIAYGSRLAKDSKVIGRTFKREIVSRVSNRILKILLGASFSDGMCGFKFLKNKVAKELIDTRLMSDGWFFCTEVLVFGQWMGYKLREIPVKWTDGSNSKVKVLKLSLEYLKRILEIRKIKRSLIK